MAVHGIDPATGRALRKDGKPRRKRRTLSAVEKMTQLAEQQKSALASIGRSVFTALPVMSSFVSGIGTFRRWNRDAVAYSTPEKRGERAEYFQRMLDIIDEKGERAEEYLSKSSDVDSVVSTLFENIGTDIRVFMEENGREPDDTEAEVIVRKYLSDDVRSLVESANDPENDPFNGLRRGDVSDDAADTDTL